MKTIKLLSLFPNSDSLGTREDGVLVRQLIESSIKKNEKVEIDFINFNTVTHSFSDEVFGILIEDIGKDKLIKLITLKNNNDNIRKIINLVISMAMTKESKQTP